MSYIDAEVLVKELRKHGLPDKNMPIEFNIVARSFHALADAIEKVGS